MISLKQLHYALAVEKTLHFKRAAELCSVSQSALSNAIIELEKQLDTQIFERNRKQILITPLGRQILAKARGIKTRVDELSQLANTEKRPLSHALTIGVIPTIGPYLLPKVLPVMQAQYPDCALRVVEESSHALIDGVHNGEIDTAIIALPHQTPGLHAFEFWQENFYLVAHHSATFTTRDGIRGEALGNTRLMLLNDGHCLKDHAIAAAKLKADDIDRTFAASNLHTLTTLVAACIGTTLVPAMALEQLLADSPELRAIRLDEPGPHRRIAFVTRLNYTDVESIGLLRDLFRNTLAGNDVAPRRSSAEQ